MDNTIKDENPKVPEPDRPHESPLSLEVKSKYFSDVNMPCLLRYDVVGFSTLIDYHKQNLAKLIAVNILQELHLNYRYPKTILQYNEKGVEFCWNGAVWDVNVGFIL